jgi:signal transduction histidine kinase/ActR/RegA family two-component response regulator
VHEDADQLEQLRQAALATSASIRHIRRKAEEDLIQAKQALEERSRQLATTVALLNATLEASPDGIVALDLSGRVLVYNARFAAIWDMPRSLLECGDGDAVAGHIASRIVDTEAYRRSVLRQQQTPAVAFREELQLKDGRFFERHATPQLIGGQCAGMVVSWRETTEQRRAEAERLALEQRLRDSQKMEALGTLAGGIAHDFNNIIAAILGNTMILRDDVLPGGEALAGLGEIERAGRRGRELVQRILSFSRRQPLNLGVLPLRPIVEDALALMRASLPASAEIAMTYPEQPVHASVDAIQISQIVMNLCTNAWQAFDGRPGRIDVALDTCHGGAVLPGHAQAMALKLCARLRVRDNGRGIEPSVQSRIFEPFFTTKPAGQGTGLGLSMVHGIVAAHQGSIAFLSVPGEGTIFELLLPLAEAPAGPSAASEAETRRPLSRRHVLYIDDDESLVFLVERLLRRRGFRVSGFVDAQAALTALRASPDEIDIVVSDYNMPRLSGLNLARIVADIRPDLPVIITSGCISDEMEVRANELGVRHLIRKENSAEELCELIGRVIESSGR